MVGDILNVNLLQINIMEKYLLIALLILLVSLTISFIIVIVDYAVFKKRIEKILDLNIEGNKKTQEVINMTKEVNDSVKQICKVNSNLIAHLRRLLKENVYLTNKLEEKEETNEE